MKIRVYPDFWPKCGIILIIAKSGFLLILAKSGFILDVAESRFIQILAKSGFSQILAETGFYLNLAKFAHCLKVSFFQKDFLDNWILPKNEQTNSFLVLKRRFATQNAVRQKKRIRSLVFWEKPWVFLKKSDL